jgi:hypothetical protein
VVIGAGATRQLRVGNSNVPEGFLENDTNLNLVLSNLSHLECRSQISKWEELRSKKFHEETLNLERGKLMVFHVKLGIRISILP